MKALNTLVAELRAETDPDRTVALLRETVLALTAERIEQEEEAAETAIDMAATYRETH